jgi:hypothetical protein
MKREEDGTLIGFPYYEVEKYEPLGISKLDREYLKTKLYILNSKMKKAQFKHDLNEITKLRKLTTLMKEFINLYATD